MLIFFVWSKFNLLLLSSIKFILKFSRSFNVINRKQRCLLLFISLCSSNVALIHRDCHFISFHLLIFSGQLFNKIYNIPNCIFCYMLLYTLGIFLTLFSSLQVIKICSVSFFIFYFWSIYGHFIIRWNFNIVTKIYFFDDTIRNVFYVFWVGIIRQIVFNICLLFLFYCWKDYFHLIRHQLNL